jgi:hypothetical protein
MHSYSADTFFWVLFSLVLATRFALPFWIFRHPLPAILACLVVDAVDQTVFQTFGYDPPFYQSYDKAMDVFYLSIAWISTMRNWMSWPAIAVSRFLFFYRQTGVVAFELSHLRALLLIFPNTFEYFFIAYEAIRGRWDVSRTTMRFWVIAAAVIWIFVKLPQEYWIHIAQLDFTDTVRDVPWFGPLVVAGIGVLLAVFWFVVRPRLPEVDHRFQIAAPRLPDEIATAAQRAAYAADHGRVWSAATAEKCALIGLLSVIFASILLPDLSPLRMFVWVGVIVICNAALSIRRARRGVSTESVVRRILLRLALNLLMIGLIAELVYRPLPLADSLFFGLLFSVLIDLYDQYRPVYEHRFADRFERR